MINIKKPLLSALLLLQNTKQQTRSHKLKSQTLSEDKQRSFVFLPSFQREREIRVLLHFNFWLQQLLWKQKCVKLQTFISKIHLVRVCFDSGRIKHTMCWTFSSKSQTNPAMGIKLDQFSGSSSAPGRSNSLLPTSSKTTPPALSAKPCRRAQGPPPAQGAAQPATSLTCWWTPAAQLRRSMAKHKRNYDESCARNLFHPHFEVHYRQNAPKCKKVAGTTQNLCFKGWC